MRLERGNEKTTTSKSLTTKLAEKQPNIAFTHSIVNYIKYTQLYTRYIT